MLVGFDVLLGCIRHGPGYRADDVASQSTCTHDKARQLCGLALYGLGCKRSASQLRVVLGQDWGQYMSFASHERGGVTAPGPCSLLEQRHDGRARCGDPRPAPRNACTFISLGLGKGGG